MAKKLIILGAGAIGRGYLPWVFPPDDCDLVFVDKDPRIISRMKERGRYVSFRVRDNQLESREFAVLAAFSPAEFRAAEHLEAVACFVNVGPRNVGSAAELMRGSPVPLVLCENEPKTVDIVKTVVGHERVFFAVPDVIASNTAPAHLLAHDPISVVTEDGTLFVDEGLGDALGGDIKLVSIGQLLNTQWAAKLYLHNTPHCIAAYLGAYVGATYVHEAMAVPRIYAAVRGAMDEMLEAMRRRSGIPMEFLHWYAEKEMARFACTLLYDPVFRVAREPLRKLEVHGRLIGAAQICLSCGVVPTNLIIGITAALLFNNQSDPDHYLGALRRALPRELFNRYILGLRGGEPLDHILRERIDDIVADLETLSHLSAP